MRIWLINHYAVPPKYYPLARPTLFAKNLIKMGHEVRIFAASTVHNSDLNLIEDGSLWRDEVVDGVPYTYIFCKNFKGNGARRFLNLLEFAWKLPKVTKHYDAPDAIVSTSMPPPSCAVGLWLAKHRYHCKAVAEIADLWPESLVSYGMAGKYHPLVLTLRRLEKWIYKTADRIVFTMFGAYDYIKEQGWENTIPITKVRFINNGVQLDLFDQQIKDNQFIDSDLDDPNTYKVVYTGSLRRANFPFLQFFDALKLLPPNEFARMSFIIYGKGELVEELQQRCDKNGWGNVHFKGYVEKKYVPYILSKCNMNVLDNAPAGSTVMKYGGSQNKLFDYLASGHPTLCGENPKISALEDKVCGVCRIFKNAQDMADGILEILHGHYEYDKIRQVAARYDFKKLTKDLLTVIEEC